MATTGTIHSLRKVGRFWVVSIDGRNMRVPLLTDEAEVNLSQDCFLETNDAVCVVENKNGSFSVRKLEFVKREGDRKCSVLFTGSMSLRPLKKYTLLRLNNVYKTLPNFDTCLRELQVPYLMDEVSLFEIREMITEVGTTTYINKLPVICVSACPSAHYVLKCFTNVQYVGEFRMVELDNYMYFLPDFTGKEVTFSEELLISGDVIYELCAGENGDYLLRPLTDLPDDKPEKKDNTIPANNSETILATSVSSGPACETQTEFSSASESRSFQEKESRENAERMDHSVPDTPKNSRRKKSLENAEHMDHSLPDTPKNSTGKSNSGLEDQDDAGYEIIEESTNDSKENIKAEQDRANGSGVELSLRKEETVCGERVVLRAMAETQVNDKIIRDYGIDSTEDNSKVKTAFRGIGKKTYTTKEGLNVFVYWSNLLQAKADCIVCPSNTNLGEHAQGAAVDIFKAAGEHTMRALCCDYLKQRGTVHVGQAIATAGGKLPFKHVIHAICPRWGDYKTNRVHEVRKCATDLTLTVTSCFLEGEKLGVKSLVLPCLSSGTNHVPLKLCARMYAEAVLDYSKTFNGNSCLSEIHFVDIREEAVKEMTSAFDHLISKEGKPTCQFSDFTT